jgi:hypothetical protein
MFVLNSQIVIGKFLFSGVHDVRITRGIHSLVETAVLQLPSIAKVDSALKTSPETVVTGRQFKEGDPVTIKIGYNGHPNTEFVGFVKERDLGIPLTVTCEGYSWLLRRNTVNISEHSITVEDYLKQAVAAIDPAYSISVVCTVDISLHKIKVIGTAMDAINLLVKVTDNCLSCFFIKPDTLWCGLVYSSYTKGVDIFKAGKVSYRLGYNIPVDNNLNEKSADDDQVQVKYLKRLSDGTRVEESSNEYLHFIRTHRKLLGHVYTPHSLQALANEKAAQLSYAGFEGYLTSLLEPMVGVGYLAKMEDSRYNDQTGHFLVESVETRFGLKGGRRRVGLGPKLIQ